MLKRETKQERGDIPYVVGLGYVCELHATDADRELKAIETIGYLGLFTFPVNYVLKDIASKLSLPVEMEITGKYGRGWLARKEVLRAIGLTSL